MIRWVADAFLILLVGFLLLFAFAVIDGVIGVFLDAWKQRKRVNRREWWTPAELDQIRAEQKQAFMDGQVSRYLARKRW